MHMLIGGFRYTAPNDGEVFFLVATGRIGVDKSGFAGAQIPITYDAIFHFSEVHVYLRGYFGAHSAHMQMDLFPDCHFIDQSEFAT